MLKLPRPLRPGDLVRVVAPSGALLETEAYEQGLQVWRSHGYRIQEPEALTGWGYLADTDERRRAELQAAWLDPECRAIVCARGGYGTARLLERWQWPELERPKWLVGFSDATNLLWSLYSLGIISVHGPVLATLAAEPPESVNRLFDLLAAKPVPSLQGQPWIGGVGRGVLLPGNLTVATHTLGTPWQPELRGVILALEDVTEAPYRIDRYLTQWRAGGHLQQIQGIALGRFSRCEAQAPSWSVVEVLRDRLLDLGIPVVADLPFGHDGENTALPVGLQAELDGDRGTLAIVDSYLGG